VTALILEHRLGSVLARRLLVIVPGILVLVLAACTTAAPGPAAAPQPKTYHFRTAPAAFTALRDGGVDLVTMANNHVLDYGRTGLADTLAAAQSAHFPYVGIGRNAAAAWAPYLTAPPADRAVHPGDRVPYRPARRGPRGAGAPGRGLLRQPARLCPAGRPPVLTGVYYDAPGWAAP
jgi:Bacterial capsule synthesis protein PGA_cap